MNKIPSSVDELMWLVAEQRDAAAIEGFTQRYPEFRSELFRRVEMVRNLKGARGPKVTMSAVPVFRPQTMSQPRIIPRWAWSTAASFGLALVAYGSYSLIAKPQPQPETPTNFSVSQPDELMGLNRVPEQNPKSPRLQYTADPNVRNANPVASEPSELVITIKYDRVALVEALSAISAASGVKIELAPNMPNPDVVLDYQGVPVSEILTDMGASFGFTAFKQSENSYLIIPAMDPDRSPANNPGGPANPDKIHPAITDGPPATDSTSDRATAEENR